MAKHKISIHENTGATSESAPYLGSYLSNETVETEKFITTVAKTCGLPPIQALAILTGAFEAIEKLEKDEGPVRVCTDVGVVCAVITGQLPTADAAFDPERNKLELALRLDDSLRLSLVNETPTIVSDANITKLRVDNLMDLEVERPMNLIHGQHRFRVACFNMVHTDEGAETYLEDSLGARHELVVDEVISKQLFTAHTAQLLPAGDYKLVAKSRAGDAEGPLQVVFRRVKYLRVEDPAPVLTSIVDASQSENGVVKLHGTSAVTLSGSGLANVTCDNITISVDGDEGSDDSHPSADGFTASESSLVFSQGFNPAEQHTSDSVWTTGDVKVTITVGGQSVELPFEYTE